MYWCGGMALSYRRKTAIMAFHRDALFGNRSKLEMLVHAAVPEGHKEAVSFFGVGPTNHPFTLLFQALKANVAGARVQERPVRLVLNGKQVGEQTASVTKRNRNTNNHGARRN